jgi:hypothetical protein
MAFLENVPTILRVDGGELVQNMTLAKAGSESLTMEMGDQSQEDVGDQLKWFLVLAPSSLRFPPLFACHLQRSSTSTITRTIEGLKMGDPAFP